LLRRRRLGRGWRRFAYVERLQLVYRVLNDADVQAGKDDRAERDVHE
jgi:hypothetical protein